MNIEKIIQLARECELFVYTNGDCGFEELLAFYHKAQAEALEKLLYLDDTSYLTQNWSLSSEQIKVIDKPLKGQP